MWQYYTRFQDLSLRFRVSNLLDFGNLTDLIPFSRPHKKLLLFLVIVFSPFCLSAKTIVVCPECTVQQVKRGVELATDGDTVLIKKGHYQENQIEIRKTIVLLGEQLPIIDGMGENEILIVFADGVVIQGLQLQNVGISFLKDRAAIRLVQCKKIEVRDNYLYNTFFGIYLQKSDSCIVRNNRIVGTAKEETSAGNAIHVWKALGILIENNYAAHHRDGIYFEFVDHSQIIHNTSEFNLRYGLHFMFSNFDLYQKNTFNKNGVGVAVMFSKHIRMLENVFEENWGGASYGILLKEISDGEMTRNRFAKNTKGIYAEGTNRLQIRHNQFIENGWAMDIKGNCLNNKIESNNFIANTFEVITNSQQSANHFKGNYWSQYQGYDLNKDGIGDIPHRPVSLFSMITDKIPAAMLLHHSLIVDLMDYTEKVMPSLIPIALQDEEPLMKPIVFKE